MIHSPGIATLCLALTATSSLLVGCAGTRGGNIPYAPSNFPVADSLSSAVAEQAYGLAPGDKLKMTVFRVEDLTSEVTVDLAGNISVPLLGQVSALGRTSTELADHLEQLYGQRYLRNPDITVAILESAGRNVVVEGAVRQPGVFPVTNETSLLAAIAQAQGASDRANERRVAVFRRVDGQRMAAAFDLVSIRRGEMDDPRIFPGDVIVVENANNRNLFRDIIGVLPILALFRPY